MSNKVNSLIKNVKNMHIAQKIYVFLWLMFVVLMVVTVLVTAFVPSSANMTFSEKGDALKMVQKAHDAMRANLIASMALLMTIFLFSAIVLTVITNGFILKKSSKVRGA
ncbi:hypothetical protein GE118_02065 [Mycoplasma sp. NEAQ87857]|uniref:hypothetical protein n=1 Tax=Mycoplasma sp. NEAQ87857 TaxID=2683967 RepID=UPI001316596A|nr:hypothetical protein [Mycoplasma sp. NEAQ87857]QGZ97580.1 hypothetical protein GE118_02065 [Mycoplasma sp. NEAQ87857]